MRMLEFPLEINVKLEEGCISSSLLIPKIPWDKKLVDCNLGSLCEEKYFFFNFFF
jgi:hypothetical protein